MWIVRLALRRPYTFIVFALLLVIVGTVSIESMPTDIFPDIDIPVIAIAWSYTGLSPREISNRLVTISERNLTTSVNDIDHMESQSYYGVGVIKVYFHSNANISNAMSQVEASCNSVVHLLPAGTLPPSLIQYRASTVPVLQLALSGSGLSEQQLYDLGSNGIRPRLATIEGASLPSPWGGKQRQIQVDLDLERIQAHQLSPSDVVNAVANESLILPAGTVKIGMLEYAVETNSSPSIVEELNDLPLRNVNGAMVYLRDVAHVRDGFPPQTNILRVDGQRAALLSVMKSGSASTLEIIASVKRELPTIQRSLTDRLNVKLMSDQSIFVKAAITGVIREGLIAGCLTAVMILLFLGSWRSTVIIAISIPLSILSSLIILWLLHQTLNIMTLGGLALAVGILVDDATVEIENINRHLAQGKPVETAILDGAAEIAAPALVATLCICIVFIPMLFLGGVAHYLFVPLAEAVIFAMLASYVLSRTLIPTLAKFLLHEADLSKSTHEKTNSGVFVRFQGLFEVGFERLRLFYLRLLTLCVDHAALFICGFTAFVLLSIVGLTPLLGRDFFPTIDSGEIKIHLRARSGLRIEETAALCDRIDAEIMRVIPSSERESIIDNLGTPYSPINLVYASAAPIGTSDADIDIQLAPVHQRTEKYAQRLREDLAEKFPGVVFVMLPADMVSQILNFGLAAPIDVQIMGQDVSANRELAAQIADKIKELPGSSDVRVQQPFDAPRLNVNVDRTAALAAGLTQRDVASSLLIALSGSAQTQPNFFVNPKNGVSYAITTQAPQYNLQSRAQLMAIPLSSSGSATLNASIEQQGSKPLEVIGSIASLSLGADQAVVSHYDIQPVVDVYVGSTGTDLGTVSRGVERIVEKYRQAAPHSTQILLRGQGETMVESYKGLFLGLAFAILFVYLLIVVNFQSLLDPLLIIAALPAALAGIVWMLLLTHTHLSVPALTGSIMCMGVATANSILVVTFARGQLDAGFDPRVAALNAGYVRFRPVLMTALAMIIGMLPMALSIGEGGEQNAPLGRAVIGGLLLGTVATLFLVPTLVSSLHGFRRRRLLEAIPRSVSNGTSLERSDA